MNSLKKQARVAGLIYMLLAAFGIFSIQYVPTILVDTGDPATTIDNIKANELLFRVNVLIEQFILVLFIFLVLALYHLFKEVDKKQAIRMVALVLVGVSFAFATTINRIDVLLIISGADNLAMFGAEQLSSMAYLHLQFANNAVEALDIFWGLWLFPFAFLCYKSRFIPRIFSFFLIIAGAAYVINSFMFFVLPQYEEAIYPFIKFLKVGELPIIFWLLIAGVKDQKPAIQKAD